MRQEPECRNTRLLVVGWDGGDYSAIGPCLADGKLPNLQALLAGGVRAALCSTTPPITPVAWPTLFTGLNAGRHGVHGWTTGPFGRGIPTDRRNVRAPACWDVWQDMGLRSLVCGVPLSWPPLPDWNGCLIASWMIPHTSEWIIPKRWAERIEQRFGKLVNYPAKEVHNSEDLKARYEAVAKQMTDVFLFTLADGEFDVGFIMYPHTDHYLHFRFDLSGAYEVVDDCLGRLLQAVGPEVPVVLVSDHGTVRSNKLIHLNRWLQQQGLLRLTDVIPDGVFANRVTAIIGRYFGMNQDQAQAIASPVIALWRSLPRRLKRIATVSLRRRFGFHQEEIDFQNTKVAASFQEELVVFSEERHGFGHLSEREAQEIEAWLCHELTSKQDPHTNSPLFSAVLARSDVCWGPHIDGAADLYPIKADPSYLMVPNSVPRGGEDEPLVEYSDRPCREGHTMWGMLAARADGIPQGSVLPNKSILDVCPTLFYLLGLPVPEYVDGEVMGDLFSAEWLDSHTISFCQVEHSDVFNMPPALEATEYEVMRSRLAGLGYL